MKKQKKLYIPPIVPLSPNMDIGGMGSMMPILGIDEYVYDDDNDVLE